MKLSLVEKSVDDSLTNENLLEFYALLQKAQKTSLSEGVYSFKEYARRLAETGKQLEEIEGNTNRVKRLKEASRTFSTLSDSLSVNVAKINRLQSQKIERPLLSEPSILSVFQWRFSLDWGKAVFMSLITYFLAFIGFSVRINNNGKKKGIEQEMTKQINAIEAILNRWKEEIDPKILNLAELIQAEYSVGEDDSVLLAKAYREKRVFDAALNAEYNNIENLLTKTIHSHTDMYVETKLREKFPNYDTLKASLTPASLEKISTDLGKVILKTTEPEQFATGINTEDEKLAVVLLQALKEPVETEALLNVLSKVPRGESLEEILLKRIDGIAGVEEILDLIEALGVEKRKILVKNKISIANPNIERLLQFNLTKEQFESSVTSDKVKKIIDLLYNVKNYIVGNSPKKELLSKLVEKIVSNPDTVSGEFLRYVSIDVNVRLYVATRAGEYIDEEFIQKMDFLVKDFHFLGEELSFEEVKMLLEEKERDAKLMACQKVKELSRKMEEAQEEIKKAENEKEKVEEQKKRFQISLEGKEFGTLDDLMRKHCVALSDEQPIVDRSFPGRPSLSKKVLEEDILGKIIKSINKIQDKEAQEKIKIKKEAANLRNILLS